MIPTPSARLNPKTRLGAKRFPVRARRRLLLESLEDRRVLAPLITALNASSVNEGGTSTLTIDFVEPALTNKQYTLQLDWGDGQGTSTSVLAPQVLDAGAGLMRATLTRAIGDDLPSGTPVDVRTVRAAIFDQTMLAYWNFDEAAGTAVNDFTGNNPGTIQGSVTRQPGLVGSGSVSFNNTLGDTVAVGSSFTAGDGFAIEALIRPTWDGTGYDGLFRRNGGDFFLFAFQNDASPGALQGTFLNQPVLSIGLNVGGYAELDMPLNVDLSAIPGGLSNSGTIYLNPPGGALGPNDVVLKDGQAHHVSATYDQATGERAIWVDGVKRFNFLHTPGTPVSTSGGGGGHIGSADGGENFSGILDEVAIYSSSLSAAVIANHAARGTTGQNYFFQTTTYTVSNVPPVVNAGSNATVFEGLFTRDITISDVPADTLTAVINYGDGTPTQVVAVTSGTYQLSHAYADNGVYNVTISVGDDDTGVTNASFILTVNNQIPVVSLPAAGQSSVEGTTYSLSTSFVDFGTLDTHTVEIFWGDGTSSFGTVTEAPFGPPGSATGLTGVINATHVYADDGPILGNYQVTIVVRDDDGGVGTTAFFVVVGNAIPVLAPVNAQAANEGQLFILPLLAFNDPGTRDTHTATINWGDNTPSTAGVVTQNLSGPPGSTLGQNGTVTGSHTYAQNGVYTATITLTDDNGGTSVQTFQVVVADLPPVATIVGPPGDTTVRNLPTEFTFSATDVPADMVGDYEYFVDWGDGNTESIVGPASGVSLIHVFPMEGDYEVSVIAVGADGVASDLAVLALEVTVVGSVVDPETGETNAVVGGSIFADRIVLSLLYTGAIQARVNNQNFRLPDVTGKILVYAGDGGDTITVAGNVPFETELYGQEGNDYITGGVLADLLDGGPGNDRLLGSTGNNIYYGGDGNDSLTGREGNEIMFGGAGRDAISGGGGNDVIDGGEDSDSINGGDGDDLIRGGAGNDVIRGERGHDILIGGDNNDTLYGNVGRDIVIGGQNADQMYGGYDDDIMIHAATIYDDNTPENDAALLAIQLAWLQAGTINTRIANILALPETLDVDSIPDDEVRDSLYGEQDADWFLVAINDMVSGNSPLDVKTILPYPT